MEQNYIYGDLVMTNGKPIGTLKGVHYKVISSDPTNTFDFEEKHYEGSVMLDNIEDCKLEDKGFLFASSSAWVKDIIPISLTEEILVKNGFNVTKSPCDDVPEKFFTLSDSYQNNFNNVDIKLIGIGDGESPYYLYVGYGYATTLKYVHQLQHFLFGCGCHINFKI